MNKKVTFTKGIRFKIIMVYICAVFIPVVVLCVYLIARVVIDANNKYIDTLEISLDQAKIFTENNVDTVAKAGRMFSSDKAIVKLIDNQDTKQAFQDKLDIIQNINNIKNQFKLVKNIKLIHNNINFVDTANLFYYDKDLNKKDKWKSKFDKSNISSSQFTDEQNELGVKKLGYGTYLLPFTQESIYMPRNVDYNKVMYGNSNSKVSTFYFPIYDGFADNKFLAILEINMKENQLFASFENFYENEEYKYFIYDNKTKQIKMSNDTNFSNYIDIVQIENKQKVQVSNVSYSKVSSNIQTLDLTVVALIPTTLISGIVDVGYIITISFFAMLVLSLGILFVYSSKMVRNLLELEHKMRFITIKSLEDEIKTPIKVNGDDEIAKLCDGYNIMIQRIDNLLKDNKLAYQKENKAIYKNLEEKLKAHFLFNALDMIRITAGANDQGEISIAIGTVMNYLTYTLKSSDEYVKVSEEVKYASCFIDMYNLVRKVKIEYVIKCSGELSGNLDSQFVLKFVIQPLVENAIKHGFQGKISDCNIFIELYSDKEYLYITIEDNGNGFDVNAPTVAKGFGIGISHVKEKLNRIFGDNYMFDVVSYDGIGTCVQIKMPVVKTQE